MEIKTLTIEEALNEIKSSKGYLLDTAPFGKVFYPEIWDRVDNDYDPALFETWYDKSGQNYIVEINYQPQDVKYDGRNLWFIDTNGDTVVVSLLIYKPHY